MDKRGYVISRVGWQYNDEVYYRENGGDGQPVLVYTNFEKAKEKCQAKNLQAFRQRFVSDVKDASGYYRDNLGDYLGYDGPQNELADLFNELGIKYEDYRIELPSDISDEALTKIQNVSNVCFYELVDVPLLDQ